jgi:hypothetical protein
MAIEINEVEIKQLLFDPQNPRLPELLGKSQKEIFRFLVDEIGIDDVLQSIAASGAYRSGTHGGCRLDGKRDKDSSRMD